MNVKQCGELFDYEGVPLFRLRLGLASLTGSLVGGTHNDSENDAQRHRSAGPIASAAPVEENRDVLQRGEIVAFLVSRERMESIFETLEILSNADAMKAVRRARSGRGKYIPLEQLEKELDEGARRA